jgi:SulP family sulfate permease
MLKVLRRAPRQDLLVMLAVFGITVLVDLIVAVTIGVTLAALMLTYRIARQTQINVLEVPAHEWQRDIEKGLQEESDYRMRTVSVRGAFFFGTTAQMQDKVNKLIGTRVVIINCLDVPFMDISAAFALSEMIERLKKDGIKSILVVTEGLGIRKLLIGLGCGDLLGADGIQVDYHKAVQVALAYLRETPSPRGRREPRPAA